MKFKLITFESLNFGYIIQHFNDDTYSILFFKQLTGQNWFKPNRYWGCKRKGRYLFGGTVNNQGGIEKIKTFSFLKDKWPDDIQNIKTISKEEVFLIGL